MSTENVQPGGDLGTHSPRRRQILDAAAHVFREKGFHGATMEDIGQLVGMNKATLYYWIPSKEAVFHEILMASMIDTLSEIDAALKPGMTGLEKLRALIYVHIEGAASRPDPTLLVMREQHALPPDLRASHDEVRHRYEDTWYEVFAQGVAEGTFREMPRRMAEFFLFGALNWFSQWYRADGAFAPEEIADVFCDLCLRGILRCEAASGSDEQRRE